MTILLTMNSGNYIGPNVEASHRAAAERWGAEYVQHTEGEDDPFGEKIRCQAYMFDRGERVCWIDGDAIIREDAPSPFDLVPAGSMGGVNGLVSAASFASALEWWQRLGHAMGLCLDFPRDYLNGGLIVFDSDMAEIWRSILRWKMVGDMHGGKTSPMAEQTAFNVFARILGYPIHDLGDRWNVMGSRAWTDPTMAHGYVYHLACIGPYRENKRSVLEGIEWRVKELANV